VSASRNKTRACHKPKASPCGEMFVAEIENRGRKFIEEGDMLTSSKGGAKHFATEGEALSASEEYIALHFSN